MVCVTRDEATVAHFCGTSNALRTHPNPEKTLSDGGGICMCNALRRAGESESICCGRTRHERRGGIVLGGGREARVWEKDTAYAGKYGRGAAEVRRPRRECELRAAADVSATA
ncbi:hypothetical protein B0H17DRAFT_1147635 [Mycena rosella]|uniref:Uncharacterized protein n=1 Tax=Mycena rosella TaxID=1033263 RepID=A0AAD7G267_MYCRO|nr:hypothetical protein B0H17DRAFT_1147635 [Mycena rosella]